MIEIYPNISKTVKDIAETAWNITLAQRDPMQAADFLNNVTEYYRNVLSDEEIEFLQFYFQMKMEMMKT